MNEELMFYEKQLSQALQDLECEIADAKREILEGKAHLASPSSTGFVKNSLAARESLAAIQALKGQK